MNSITLQLAKELIEQQFPQWAELYIRPVEFSGIDNRTFHLGEEMLIRLPSSENYALQAPKEQKWLKVLAPHVSLSIPEPVAMGQPSKHYPWNWSIYKWINGKSANMVSINELDLQTIAFQLARFLNKLHKINAEGGPSAGLHNYWRGGHAAVYDKQTRSSIKKLKNIIDTKTAIAVWERAISSKWDRSPVWVHGDLASSNIIVKEGSLTGIIDFGCMGIGDPACDLVIAYTLLRNESRRIFKENLYLDTDTWARARGWALWKALITIVSLKDKSSKEAVEQQRVINEILNEYDNILE
ncbi:MAG: aminoglycoside phosphotransferase family protein [Wolbachia endosymbiont of Tyrophagus putrescentiae]|nr:aminoglycoside phosphotransferase family protein [Wolbachia endosymbiont of Tyrophagus putrescentiae]MDN5248969.1 aminoglycoside phosphotransferase family protein [Alphaproteobacteria bacterium]